MQSATHYNIGLPLGQGGLVAIDIDTDNPDHIDRIIACLPPIRATKRGKRGFTAFFLTDGDHIPTQRLGLVEVLSHGTQTVIPPSVHPDTGEAYVWLDPQGLGGVIMGTYRHSYERPNFCELTGISDDHIERLRAVASQISGRQEVKPLVQSIHPVRKGPLPPDQFDRYRRYFGSAYQADLAALAAMSPNTGRNKQAFRFVCRFGRLVHHGLMPADRMIADVVEACTANGLVAEDGMRAIHATIVSGLQISAQDAIPDLEVRHG